MVSPSAYRYGDDGRRKDASPLRQRMIDDMNLAGLAPSTQQNYIDAVVRLQKASGIRPDRLKEADVRRYLVDMRNTVAKGTFQTNFYGLKFFYYRTLDSDWSLFVKKRWHSRDKGVSRSHCLSRIAAA